MSHPMTDSETRWFFTIFPFLFVGIWLAISTMLGVLSGWFALQRQYPRGDRRAMLTLRGKSGSMGIGVAMNGILTLSACDGGLRIGISRIFGPFQRPFLVPWSAIRAEPKRVFFVPSTKLRFGSPEIGSLTVDAAAWQRLAAFAPAIGRGAAPLVTEPVSRRQFGAGLLRQWAVVAGAAGTLFFVASRNMAGPGAPLPALVCYVFAAVAFGIPQLIRWVRYGG